MFVQFPDPRLADGEEGLVAVDGELEVDWLVSAYEQGIFPWPHEGYPLLWFSPPKRGVLDFKDLHLPHSFKKWVRKNESDIEVRWNGDFESVIRACALQKRTGQKGTWITKDMIMAYIRLFNAGHAICVECFRDNKLIGGTYGVRSKKYCSLESMFFREPNASKYALVKAVENLKQLGFDWVDIQMVTDASEQFGGKYISRDQFLKRISR